MNRIPLFAVASLIALAACQTTGNAATDRIGSATLHFADGKPAGTVELKAAGDTVTVSGTLAGFPQGVHAIHLHTTGLCEGPDFKTAGGHLNPGMHQHGMDNPMGSHLGDMPNVDIAADGTGKFSTTLRGTRMDVTNALFDADGTAVVVHAGPDDYKTDPAGNAGSRLACGVITKG